MRLLPLGLVSLTTLALLSGCKAKKQLQHDEDLQSVVAADRRLTEKENRLLSRRGVLQRERSTVRNKREEILTKKMTLAEDDAIGKQTLEQEETKLAKAEASLMTQELSLSQKLQALLDEKSGLVDRLTKEKGEKGEKDALVVRREYTVTLREKDLARRETELARRERALADREEAFAERQARGCPKSTTVVQTVVAPPLREVAASTSRKDVEPIYRAALNEMQTKGILTADLPPGVDRLVTEVRHSMASGDNVRAKYAADQLLANVRKIKIDRGFIGSKISRLSSAIRAAPPPAGQKAKVNTLFQEATAHYGDGRFGQANRLLNQIYGLLR